jgi:hypothetical protein
MGGRPGYMEKVPAAPFVAWVNGELERRARLDEGANGSGAMKALAMSLRVNGRTVYRWKNSLDSERDQVVTEYPRRAVENALLLADVTFEDLYPEVVAAEDVDLEADAFCSSCRDVVTPIAGVCPWCDKPTTPELPNRLYCPREDKMSLAAMNGNCWHCGGKLQRYMPMHKCKCGCGTEIPRFEVTHGKPVNWVRGHAPSTLEHKVMVPTPPLKAWLEEELRNLDPIQALGRRTGFSRENVLDILNGRVDEIPIETVRRSLFRASMEGQGRGLPPRPGSKTLTDLYPEYVRSLTCPSCGNRKAPHSELCRKCRTAAGQPNGRGKSLTPDLLEEARRIREAEGVSFMDIAERIQPRTRCTNPGSLKAMMLVEFKARGWSTSRTTRKVAA